MPHAASCLSLATDTPSQTAPPCLGVSMVRGHSRADEAKGRGQPVLHGWYAVSDAAKFNEKGDSTAWLCLNAFGVGPAHRKACLHAPMLRRSLS